MKNILCLLLMVLAQHVYSQTFIGRTGTITFFSEAPLENIEATNHQVSGVFVMPSGEIAFSLLMKAFTFKKALMQDHFNDKYVESDIYPKATFRGQIDDMEKIDWNIDRNTVSITGDLTIHGVTNPVTVDGVLERQSDGNVLGTASFYISLADYGVKIPKAVMQNISEEVYLTINMPYEKMD